MIKFYTMQLLIFLIARGLHVVKRHWEERHVTPLLIYYYRFTSPTSTIVVYFHSLPIRSQDISVMPKHHL